MEKYRPLIEKNYQIQRGKTPDKLNLVIKDESGESTREIYDDSRKGVPKPYSSESEALFKKQARDKKAKKRKKNITLDRVFK